MYSISFNNCGKCQQEFTTLIRFVKEIFNKMKIMIKCLLNCLLHKGKKYNKNKDHLLELPLLHSIVHSIWTLCITFNITSNNQEIHAIFHIKYNAKQLIKKNKTRNERISSKYKTLISDSRKCLQRNCILQSNIIFNV